MKKLQKKSKVKKLKMQNERINSQVLLQTAIQAYQAGNLKQALLILEQALLKDPNQSMLQFYLGHFYREAGDYLKALEAYLKTIQLAPDFDKPYLDLTNIFYKLQRQKETLQYLEKARCILPDNFDIIFNLGHVYRDTNQIEPCIACYQKAIELRPDFDRPYLDLANMYYQIGVKEKIMPYFTKATQLLPTNFELHFNFARVLFELGYFKEAIKHYQQAIAIQPNNPLSYYNLGNTFIALEEQKEALAYFEKAIFLKPDFTMAHTRLHHVLKMLDQPEIEKKIYLKRLINVPQAMQIGPKRIRLETSNACNLRCQHCPTGTNYHLMSRGIMQLPLFDKILAQLKTMPILNECVMYLAGEPLLNHNLALMCRRIKEETHIQYTLFNTNGMLIDQEICKALQEAKIDHISISIDGRSPMENDQIRKGSHYASLVEKVYLLKKALPDTRLSIVNTIIKKTNDPEVPVLPDFLARDFPGFIFALNYAMKWPGLSIDKTQLKNLAIEKVKPKKFCAAPFTEMSIRTNGDVVLCCYDLLSQNIVDNIHQTSLMDIWNGTSYNKLRYNMLYGNYDLLPEVCQQCYIFNENQLLLLKA